MRHEASGASACITSDIDDAVPIPDLELGEGSLKAGSVIKMSNLDVELGEDDDPKSGSKSNETVDPIKDNPTCTFTFTCVCMMASDMDAHLEAGEGSSVDKPIEIEGTVDDHFDQEEVVSTMVMSHECQCDNNELNEMRWEQ
mmetsp:Transcript_30372/g.69998  ORF Transcript_30372/g.69998 Transcript_30372/m.69998 type:complete len:142 (-) Transcript_30372:489-914(-)